MGSAGLKTQVYDCVEFYHHFTDISVQKLSDNQVIKRVMLQCLKRDFTEKNISLISVSVSFASLQSVMWRFLLSDT